VPRRPKLATNARFAASAASPLTSLSPLAGKPKPMVAADGDRKDEGSETNAESNGFEKVTSAVSGKAESKAGWPSKRLES
jgi:hypothetical protein